MFYNIFTKIINTCSIALSIWNILESNMSNQHFHFLFNFRCHLTPESQDCRSSFKSGTIRKGLNSLDISTTSIPWTSKAEPFIDSPHQQPEPFSSTHETIVVKQSTWNFQVVTLKKGVQMGSHNSCGRQICQVTGCGTRYALGIFWPR